MELEVQIKNVYGVERIYPINDTAINFSNLTRKKTLEQNDEGFYTDNTRMIFNDFFKVEPSYYGEYDFVLTSPPYSNTEQYNGMEEFNAINNYYNDFLIPLINKLLENILVGGTVCINISNHIYLEYLRCGGKVADEIEEMPQQTANKKNKEMVYIFKKQ